MGAHIVNQSAASCIGKCLALVLAISRDPQAVQRCRFPGLPLEGNRQRFRAADVRAGIAHRHGAHGDAANIRLAVHIGFAAQDEIGVRGKGAVRHDDLGRSVGVQHNRVRIDSHSGDVLPFHIALQGAAVGVPQQGDEFHRFRVEGAACDTHFRAQVHDSLAPHPAHAENRDGGVARAELARGVVDRAQMERLGGECAECVVVARDFGCGSPLVLDGGVVHRHIRAAHAYALSMGFQRVGFLRVDVDALDG